jgi:Organic solute transporter Ostalpha
MMDDNQDGIRGQGPPMYNFSLGPPSSENPADDSGMMDDNDLTTSFLPRGESDEEEAVNYSQILAAATRPHSGIRLVMRRIGNFIGTFTLLGMLIVIPVVTYQNLIKEKVDIAAFDSAGVMVAGTIILSVRLVYLHFTHWYMPNVQKYVVRILWMVPLYAIQSWLSLRFRDARIYIDAGRDLYEAYVISNFLYYLIELLGGQDGLLQALRTKARNNPNEAEHLGSHGFPLNLVLEPWNLGLEFMLQCKHGVLQYVVIKGIATVFTFAFQSMDVYGEGQFRWNVAYPYLAFILNISVMYALYCLVKLFHAINDDLRHPIDWHPLGKFLCVKGVVFFTWWQGVIIFYLYAHGIIKDVGAWTGEEVANGLIDYCVCIEMVFFALAHSYTFTYTEYLPSTVEEAMSEYEQQNPPTSDGNRSSTYRPPATLPRPMTFKDAFLSSTFPTETFHDIRRLHNGVDHVVSQVTDPGAISLQDFPTGRTEGIFTNDS